MQKHMNTKEKKVWFWTTPGAGKYLYRFKLAQTLLNLMFVQIYFIDAQKCLFFTEAEIKMLI